MRVNMDESDVEEFDAFIERNWGDQIRKEKMQKQLETVGVAVSEDAPKRRGRKPKNEQ